MRMRTKAFATAGVGALATGLLLTGAAGRRPRRRACRTPSRRM